ncbi:hypothetical protein [Nitratireductor sp. XY-223]|uniref:hypothetical protein n=1 Tax=Nitratireductor sp. XY-223 TaxID=2561926 RepID=UPI0010AB28FD|nr:hypothetical protein [Nitratireductor sp. XY-223]
MRVAAILFTIFLSATAFAEERRLSGDEIANLLPAITASIGTVHQTFESNGDTVFTQGSRVSSGRWRVRDNLYCSTWPPSDAWRCYEVRFEKSVGDAPDRIIWVDTENREETVNFILPKAQ